MILRIYIVTIFVFLSTQILNAEKHLGGEAEINFDSAVKFVEKIKFSGSLSYIFNLSGKRFPCGTIQSVSSLF